MVDGKSVPSAIEGRLQHEGIRPGVVVFFLQKAEALEWKVFRFRANFMAMLRDDKPCMELDHCDRAALGFDARHDAVRLSFNVEGGRLTLYAASEEVERSLAEPER